MSKEHVRSVNVDITEASQYILLETSVLTQIRSPLKPFDVILVGKQTGNQPNVNFHRLSPSEMICFSHFS